MFLSQVSSVLITSVDSFDSRSEEVVPNISREKKHSVSKEMYANLSTVGTSLFQEQIKMSHWPPGTLSVLPKSVPPKSQPPKNVPQKSVSEKSVSEKSVSEKSVPPKSVPPKSEPLTIQPPCTGLD